MITPQFSVRQDERFVYIDIRAPNIKASEVEFYAHDDLFIFSLHPYYLRLRFPGNLKDDQEEQTAAEDDVKDEDRSDASYDMKTSMVAVRVPKQVQGEYFEDLDMIAKLLARKNEPTANKSKSLIQEVGESSDINNNNSDNNIKSMRENAEEFDWEIEQKVPVNEELAGSKYGFDNAYSGELGISLFNGNDINDVVDPETCPIEEREKLRVQVEDGKFDPEYYLADFMENLEIEQTIIPWQFLSIASAGDFTREEQYVMSTKLPKKSYLLDDVKATYVGIVSIVFAYAFDIRTTMGDSTVESAWTIGKLCPQASALVTFQTVPELIVACTRRALAYALYRHWNLVTTVWQDVYRILRMGADDKRVLVKILIHIVQIFDSSERYYNIYNKILFLDYASWLQSADTAVIRSLAHEVHKFELKKNQIGWDLEELEDEATAMQDRH